MDLRQIVHPSFFIGGEWGFLPLFDPSFKISKPKGNSRYFLAVKNKNYCSAIYEQ